MDPSLGGIGGMSLTRFMIRQFPDPVTEGLSFWKAIHDNCFNKDLCAIAINIGNPTLVKYRHQHFSKLIEDPTSLNLARGISATNMLKNEVRKGLLSNIDSIEHVTIRQVLTFTKSEGDRFIDYLSDITPCFPKFIEEFHSATYFGIAEALIGLFQGSRTIRNITAKYFQRRVDNAILHSELGALETLVSNKESVSKEIWRCSSSQADSLRKTSWDRDIIGTTIPRPFEMLNTIKQEVTSCPGCNQESPSNFYVSSLIPKGIFNPIMSRGPYPPYLGSDTQESTSLLQPWEKKTNVPFMKRPMKILNCESWFVEKGSNLGKALHSNIIALTGVDVGSNTPSFKRTGSALHRFSSSRQSSGGYAAQSPINATRT
jgi:hypothetical protein